MAQPPALKRRRLSPPDYSGSSPPDKDSNSVSTQWTLEQEYERRPRKKKEAAISLRLPIKMADGRLERAPAIPTMFTENGRMSSNTPELDSHGRDKQNDHKDINTVEIITKISPSIQRQQMVEAKEELARLAALINQDPEDQISLLGTLAHITSSKDPAIIKLGLATQLAVYKDIIPGYRIRQMMKGEAQEKLSKDVRKLRNFEQAIVINYQRYVKELSRMAALRKQSSSVDASNLATVAISCACNLLKAVPHFNFRTDLLKILIDALSTRAIDQNFTNTCAALRSCFENDEDGNASLEVVAALAKMMKARKFCVHPDVLNLFLYLRLLTEFSKKGSSTSVDRAQVETYPSGRGRNLKREFRTKKQRKYIKERKTIEDEFNEADAAVSHEQREQVQAETLKIVFSVYFRTLQARNPTLMGPVLEGLVKYAHLINQNFFGDLLEALQELIEDARTQRKFDKSRDDGSLKNTLNGLNILSRDATRESLLCIIAAFALLQGQDIASAASSLHLDLSFFVSHLYSILYEIALCAGLETNSLQKYSPSQRSALTTSDQSKTKVDIQTTVVLLLRSLQAVMLPTNSRSVPPIRIGAFTKQTLTSSLHVPEKSCTAMIGLIIQVLKTHHKKIVALFYTEERKEDGTFNPLRVEIEASNPFATTVWEVELLRWHYAPSVRQGVKSLEAAIVDI